MSIGPTSGIAAGAAGAPLAQTKGSEVERSQHETSVQQGRVQSETKAASAAGIGETDGQDHQTAERDADGRRPWEIPPRKKAAAAVPPAAASPKDPTGQSGGLLDLSG
jgi:hypothetical protein